MTKGYKARIFVIKKGREETFSPPQGNTTRVVDKEKNPLLEFFVVIEVKVKEVSRSRGVGNSILS